MRHEYTLFRRKDKKVWYFYYYDKQGKRVSRSTGQAAKYKAEQFVQDFLTVTNVSPMKNIVFKDYASSFYIWDSFPHITR